MMTVSTNIFERLKELPAGHMFWKNKWMFTKSVFSNESRQMTDQKLFSSWLMKQYKPLYNYINNAPFAKNNANDDWLDTSKACNVQDGECEACQ